MQVVSYDGATYQSLRDTAQKPGGSDWICLAVADKDGITPRVRGTFSANIRNSISLRAVAARSSRVATILVPVPVTAGNSLRLPGKKGDRGSPGPRGETGPKGEQGPPGPIIASWEVDHEHYRARATMSDGTDGPTLDLRGMFERYHTEAR